MFETAKKVKLLPSDLARLLKVNRVTVSLWYNGHANPHRLLTEKVTKLLDAVRRGAQAGDLPVPAELERDRAKRRSYIQDVIVKHLKARTVSAQAA